MKSQWNKKIGIVGATGNESIEELTNSNFSTGYQEFIANWHTLIEKKDTVKVLGTLGSNKEITKLCTTS